MPRKCMTDVGSLALSSPAETCAGGWGLILRVWVPAHSLNSGEAAPEARPAGGALRARLIGESTASSVASLLGRRGGSRAQSRGKPCLHGAQCAPRTQKLVRMTYFCLIYLVFPDSNSMPELQQEHSQYKNGLNISKKNWIDTTIRN